MVIAQLLRYCNEREKMLRAMRVIRVKADGYHKESRDLSPTQGRIPVGSAHIRAYQKGEALSTFLRLLSLHAPSAALFFAKAEAKLIADNWNARHGYQTEQTVRMDSGV
jgi:hypothetical protein